MKLIEFFQITDEPISGVLKNPSPEELIDLLRRSAWKELRGLSYGQHDSYWWDATQSVHSAMHNKLMDKEGKVSEKPLGWTITLDRITNRLWIYGSKHAAARYLSDNDLIATLVKKYNLNVKESRILETGFVQSIAYWYNTRTGAVDYFVRDEDEMEHHFDRVLDNPKKFGLTSKDLRDISDTGDLIYLLSKKGWARMNVGHGHQEGYIDAGTPASAKKALAWLQGKHPSLRRVHIETGWHTGNIQSKNIDLTPRMESRLDEVPLPPDWDKGVYQPSTSFKKRVEYAKQRAQKMGAGSARIAFDIEFEGRPTVLKIAKNKKGIAQNEFEAQMFSDYYVRGLNITIPMIDYDEENPHPTWIHTEKAGKVTPTMFRKFFGITHHEMHYLLSYGTGTGLSWMVSDKDKVVYQDLIDNNETLDDLVSLIGNYGLPTGDFGRLANWGTYQNRLVIIDLGLSQDIYKQYYESVNEEDWTGGTGDPRKDLMLMRALQQRRKKQEGKLDIIENPNRAQFMNISKQAARQKTGPRDSEEAVVKGLLDPTTGTFWIWNPWYAIHDEIAKRLISQGYEVDPNDFEKLTGYRYDPDNMGGFIGYIGDFDVDGKLKHYFTFDNAYSHPSVVRALGKVWESINNEATLEKVDDIWRRAYSEGDKKGFQKGSMDKENKTIDRSRTHGPSNATKRGRITRANAYDKAFEEGFQDGYYDAITGGYRSSGLQEDEQHYGKSLADSGYQYGSVQIYRAAPAHQTQFRPGDWVTTSRKFAKGHADHVAAVDEEDAHVIAAMVRASDVYHERNPGEFKYNGPEPRRVRVIYKAPAVTTEIVHGSQQSTHTDDPGDESVQPWIQADPPHGWHS